MSKIFSPKIEAPKMPEKAPDAATPAVQAAADAERRRKRTGVAANVLTSSSGAASAPVGTTKLLGG